MTTPVLTVLWLLVLVSSVWAQATSPPGVLLLDEGLNIGRATTLDCRGPGIICTQTGGVGRVEVSGGSGGAGTGTVYQIDTTSPLAGGPITTSGTISIADFIGSGTGHARGTVPDPGATAGTTKYLREDATWAVPPGAGGGVTSVTGTSNQVTATPTTGAVVLSLPVGLVVPGSLTVTTTTGTPASFATLDSLGKIVAGASYTVPAPVTAQYWVGAVDATLTNEKNLGALTTGLVINTAGTPSAYAGTSCTNQFPRSLNGSGQATCATVQNTDLANSSFTLNGNSVSLGGTASVGTLTSVATTAPITGGTITGSGTIGITDFVASGASHARGAVPDPGVTSGTTKYLREDATWAVPPGAAGAPVGASYWTATTEPGLTSETNLGALTTGLLLNTVATGTATPSAYAGTSCTNQFPRSLNASGSATCNSVANADLANSTVGISGTANQITSSTSSVALGGSTTLSLPATVVAPGSVTVTTRTGTPSTFATFDSGGKLVDGASYAAPAPASAQYWTGAADTTLSAEKNLGALGTGLVLNTAGTPSAYAGTSCANQFPRSLNASGGATCASVANADLVNTATTVNGVTCTLGSPCTIPVGTGTVTSFSAGTLSPLFTTSVATASTTPALSFTQSTAPSNTIFANSTGAPAAPTFTTMDLLLDRSYGTTQGNMLFRGALGWQALNPGTSGQLLQTGGPAAAPSWTTPATVIPPPCGRLTLTSGVPVTTADVSGSTIYYTPYLCNSLTIWDGTKYVRNTFAETSLALGSMVANRPYDIFGFLIGSTLVLEAIAWTNNTTRASAITISEGMWLKASDGRLLLGTIYTTSSSTTEDSAGGSVSQVGGKRFVSNVYNRRPRHSVVFDASSLWTYTNHSVWRVADGATSPSNCIEWVNALPEQNADMSIIATMYVGSSVGNAASIGVGINGGNPGFLQTSSFNVAGVYQYSSVMARWQGSPGAGRQVACWMELGGDGSNNVIGVQAGQGVSSGMAGTVWN
jgi:hypothetical protein